MRPPITHLKFILAASADFSEPFSTFSACPDDILMPSSRSAPGPPDSEVKSERSENVFLRNDHIRPQTSGFFLERPTKRLCFHRRRTLRCVFDRLNRWNCVRRVSRRFFCIVPKKLQCKNAWKWQTRTLLRTSELPWETSRLKVFFAIAVNPVRLMCRYTLQTSTAAS